MHLLSVRHGSRSGRISHKILITLLFFLLGFLLGMMSKRLDITPSDRLPAFLESIDVRTLFGRTPVWTLIALAIALFSRNPRRAAINVLLFFVGAVGSYCLFSYLWAGFVLDRGYLTVWLILTALSPLLAFIVWYAKGRGALGTAISALVIAYFILTVFSFNADFSSFEVAFGLIEVFFLVAVITMLYAGIVQCFISAGAAIALAYLIRLTGFSIPYVL